MKLNDTIYMRISLNGYNSQNDLDLLRSAIIDIQSNTDLLL